MLLCLDIGNSQVYGGVFDNEKLLFTFRFNSQQSATSDEIGVFLRMLLRENSISERDITAISYCSVVPEKDYSFRAACIKYINVEPFIIQPGVKTGLKIHYKNCMELGADRIANAISVTNMFPNKNLIVFDFGTATTVCTIDANKNYLGGLIVPGMKIAMEALRVNTAKLPYVQIKKPQTTLGRSTVESIQSGIYHAQLALIKEVKANISKDILNSQDNITIGTGGFAHLFEDQNVFTVVVPDLVLHGLRIAHQINHEKHHAPQ